MGSEDSQLPPDLPADAKTQVQELRKAQRLLTCVKAVAALRCGCVEWAAVMGRTGSAGCNGWVSEVGVNKAGSRRKKAHSCFSAMDVAIARACLKRFSLRGGCILLPRADEDFQTDIVNPDVKAAMQVIKETNSTEK